MEGREPPLGLQRYDAIWILILELMKVSILITFYRYGLQNARPVSRTSRDN